MKLAGLQKLSLLDYPDKICAIVFTPGCNFRCPFCHNPDLVRPNRPSYALGEEGVEEFMAFLKTRQSRLDGICLTGGEPLLQEGVDLFLRRVKELGFLVKLDTNGSFPDRLETLLGEKLLDYVAMDVKNTLPLYARTVGLSEVDAAALQRSRDTIIQTAPDYEFRTTVVRPFHGDNLPAGESLIDAIGQWLKGAKRWVLQNYRKTGPQLSDEPMRAYSKEEMNLLAEEARRHVPEVILR
ncbi:MAG: anaerobic ribonucleoside-triphosphate reductase activating protein [Thermoguttaceae bacterium]|nr:anaerobic ribonucleoside-triphosphate reductase activating protein [Thermoguttaceae bacterium]